MSDLNYKRFWLVWNPSGREPLFKHWSEESAIAEATRLARLNHGHTFVVLEAKCARTMRDIVEIGFTDAVDDIPWMAQS